MTKALLVSVGGSPAPIIYSIDCHKPDYLILFASDDSRKTAVQQVLPALQSQPKDREFLMTPDEQDLEKSVCVILKRLPDILQTWGLEFCDLVADYTGGTKTMSAAVVLALSGHLNDFSYVGGTERDKNGLGVVINGKESMLYLKNPWNELAIESLKDMALLFNRCRFQSVVELADLTGRKTPNRKPVFDAIKAVAESYYAWDNFYYGKAFNKLREAESKMRMLTANSESWQLAALRQGIAANLPFLESVVCELNRIVKSTPKEKGGNQMEGCDGTLIIRDLLANAVRRAEVEYKYDDAVARLYSAIEKMAKVRLKTGHGIDNSNLLLEQIPEGAFREEILRACANEREGGKIQLPLLKSYQFLAFLKDPLGVAGMEKIVELGKVLTTRNMSLLAHGFEPVRQETYQQMLEIALHFLAAVKGDLPSFPQMALEWEWL